MKYKNLFFTILTLAVIVIAGVFLIRGENTTSNGNSSGNAQIVKLSVEGGRYVLSPSEFKKDIPVRIEADISKMPGCSKSIVISAFNVRKTVTTKDNVIEFTPTKTGTFNIACSMNMYRGTFTVV
ncbi:MAG: cupredoxin domain-containing protein [Nanoarchaeota archaeon]